jgi:hypothetical protein
MAEYRGSSRWYLTYQFEWRSRHLTVTTMDRSMIYTFGQGMSSSFLNLPYPREAQPT